MSRQSKATKKGVGVMSTQLCVKAAFFSARAGFVFLCVGFMENSPEGQGVGQVEWESLRKYSSKNIVQGAVYLIQRGKAQIAVTCPMKFH